MSASGLSLRSHVLVLVALLVLTAATVGVSFLDIRGRWHLASGLGIAVVKASLVALFFMHVVHSRAATRAVIVVAIFWLAAVLIGLILTDYTTRALVPGAPGH